VVPATVGHHRESADTSHRGVGRRNRNGRHHKLVKRVLRSTQREHGNRHVRLHGERSEKRRETLKEFIDKRGVLTTSRNLKRGLQAVAERKRQIGRSAVWIRNGNAR